MSRNEIMDYLKSINISAESTLPEVIKEKAERVPEKVYLTYIRDFDKGIDEKYTYKDMHLKSNQLGNGFMQKLGMKKGDGIALIQINSPEFLFTLFATYKIGGYVVFINTGLKGDGLQYIIDHSDSKILVIHWSLFDRYVALKDQ